MAEKEKILEFLRGEFIGRRVRILESSNKDLIGLEGKIVDETRDMLKIETEKGIKLAQKKICKFLFIEENVLIDGSIIGYRPEDRLNCKFREW